MSHELTAYLFIFNLFKFNELWPYLSKAYKPDNFESHNSLKLTFTNIRGLWSNFVDHVFADHVFVSVSIDFPNNSQRDAPFHPIAYDCSRADWVGLRNHLRDVPWQDIFKLSASAAASEFCEWAQIGITVYLPHRKYQLKPHLSWWFSAVCAAAIVHRNHFFHLYQRGKSSDFKVKFR